mmetsp:Transcript_79385/g.220904  ORF Transcript_79385/g.220904 Transcript_79385/m.220904 type:complete len:492 (-) Transcript_79385:50-1525(-)
MLQLIAEDAMPRLWCARVPPSLSPLWRTGRPLGMRGVLRPHGLPAQRRPIPWTPLALFGLLRLRGAARRAWRRQILRPASAERLSPRHSLPPNVALCGAARAALCGSARMSSNALQWPGGAKADAPLISCLAGRMGETEEDRLRLDQEARDGMEEYMRQVENLAEQGNVRAQKTAWKWKVRKKVWNYLEDNDLADFPRPVHHRIPNFKGSMEAGKRLAQLPEFLAADVVKVNPDTPQKSVRVATLRARKTLYVPQPRLRTGFFSRILPGTIPEHKFGFAATAGGMKQLAEPLGLEDRTKIDIVVIGSSAVNPENGARVGKGEGFAELEYGMMRQLGMIDESTPVVTCVHDCQVITENMPPKGKEMMTHDVPVDIIVTPTRILRVDPAKRFPKPTGIYWDLLSEQKIAQIKVLRTLKAMIESETGAKLQLAEQEEALPPLAKRGQRASGAAPGPRAGGRSPERSPADAEPAEMAAGPVGVRSKLSRRPAADR